MSFVHDLPSLAHYVSRRQLRARVMRKHAKYPFEVQAIPWADCALAVALVTKRRGIVLWGEVWPFDERLRGGWCGASALLNRMLDRYRCVLCKPSEYRVMREDWIMDAEYPKLHWHLTSDVRADGKPRQRSKLNVWVSNDRWKGFVRDNNTRFLCWGDGATFGELLAMLDARLNGGQEMWRKDVYFHGDSKRTK